MSKKSGLLTDFAEVPGCCLGRSSSCLFAALSSTTAVSRTDFFVPSLQNRLYRLETRPLAYPPSLQNVKFVAHA